MMSFTSIMQKQRQFDFTTAPDSVLFDADLVASYGHMLDAECDVDCDLNCLTVVSEDSRQEAYYKFDQIAERRVAQNMYLCACIELKQQTVDTEDHIIEQTIEFWLGDTIKIKVCKTFFARTLGFPETRLDVLLNNETFEWFSKYKSFAITDDGKVKPTKLELACYDTKQLCSEFVVNSRKHLDKNYSGLIEETDSDVDVCLDDIFPSIYTNVINHIQTVPRIVISWKNEENNKMFKFESSLHFHNMYSNYLKKSTKNHQKVTKKQYKKIYNKYVKSTFMVPT